MPRLLAAALLWLCCALAGAADSPIALPTLTARVTDLTGTLGADQRQALEARLAQAEAQKGSQIAVLLLPTTGPEAIEQFGIRLAEAWKVGRKGVDDGIILILVKNDRRLRIEVGYGLEGVLNDAVCKRIISEVMTPRLKQGDYYGAVQAGVEAIVAKISGEALPAPAATAGSGAGGSLSLTASLDQNVFLGILIGVVVIGAALRFFLGNLVASGLVGSVTGVLGWLLTGNIIGVLIGAAGGVFVALFGLNILLSLLLSRGGSGGWGGGGGGGGGFSGGGGSFGGGGASGSW